MSQTPELKGYCPVTYFLANKPLAGSSEFVSTHEGKLYYFVSEEAKQVFEKSPASYVPAYDDKCAFGMSIEKEIEPCPKNFKIIDGKLYLFLHNDDTDALELWNKEDEAKCLANADQHWSTLQGAC